MKTRVYTFTIKPEHQELEKAFLKEVGRRIKNKRDYPGYTRTKFILEAIKEKLERGKYRRSI